MTCHWYFLKLVGCKITTPTLLHQWSHKVEKYTEAFHVYQYGMSYKYVAKDLDVMT